jgi:hypothetical protein
MTQTLEGMATARRTLERCVATALPASSVLREITAVMAASPRGEAGSP